MSIENQQPEPIVTELPPRQPEAPPMQAAAPAVEVSADPPGPVRLILGLVVVLAVASMGAGLLYILFLRHFVDGVRNWFGV